MVASLNHERRQSFDSLCEASGATLPEQSSLKVQDHYFEQAVVQYNGMCVVWNTPSFKLLLSMPPNTFSIIALEHYKAQVNLA